MLFRYIVYCRNKIYLWAAEYWLFTKSSTVSFINSICQNTAAGQIKINTVHAVHLKHNFHLISVFFVLEKETVVPTFTNSHNLCLPSCGCTARKQMLESIDWLEGHQTKHK